MKEKPEMVSLLINKKKEGVTVKEETILLNYMYTKGYSDEDMYNEEVIASVKRSIVFIFHKMGLAFKNILKNVSKVVTNIWEDIKPALIKYERLKVERGGKPILKIPYKEYRNKTLRSVTLPKRKIYHVTFNN